MAHPHNPDEAVALTREAVDMMVARAVDVVGPLSCEHCRSLQAIALCLAAASELAVTNDQSPEMLEMFETILNSDAVKRGILAGMRPES